MKIIQPSYEFFPSSTDLYKKIERCGRTCYQSFDKISDNSDEKFIKMILSRRHYTVLEHGQIIMKMKDNFEGWMTTVNIFGSPYLKSHCNHDYYLVSGNVRAWVEFFEKLDASKITSSYYLSVENAFRSKYPLLFGETFDYSVADISWVTPSELDEEEFCALYRPTVKIIADRGFLAEITRHRLASFSVESTRYCNYSNDKFGNEITMIEPSFYVSNNTQYVLWHNTCLDIEKAYFALLETGSTPQEARSILPNSLKTEIIMTADIEEWNHIFELRCAEAAHPQMREIMIPMRDSFSLLLRKKFI